MRNFKAPTVRGFKQAIPLEGVNHAIEYPRTICH
jgi:hypothetical protein